MAYVSGLGANDPGGATAGYTQSAGYKKWLQDSAAIKSYLASKSWNAAQNALTMAFSGALGSSLSTDERKFVIQDKDMYQARIDIGRRGGAVTSTPIVPAKTTYSSSGDIWFSAPVRVHQSWYDTGKLPANTRIANGWVLRDTGNGITLSYPSQGIVHPVDGDSTPKPLSSFQNTTIRHWNTGEILYQSGSGDDESSGILDSIGSGITSLFSAIGDAVPKVAPSIVQAVEQKRADTAARRAQRSAQQETQEARAGIPSWVLPVAGVLTLVALGYWYTKPKQIATSAQTSA